MSRLAAVLAEIKSGFANAKFSVRDVAARLSLSARYIQVLLHETGRSFSERVIELRLQKARSMLASSRYAQLRVSQIAMLAASTRSRILTIVFVAASAERQLSTVVADRCDPSQAWDDLHGQLAVPY